MRFRTWLMSVCCVFLLALAASPAFGQGTFGTLRGEVQDPAGALVVGARVTLTNLQTGDSRTQTTTSAGTYSFPNLVISRYTLRVEAAGFKSYVRSNIDIRSNQVTEVIAQLEVGEVSEVVEVAAGAEVVQTTTSQLTGVSFKDQIGELPTASLTGRVENYAILAPGTTTQPGGVVGEGGAIGGIRPRMNSFMVDGVDNNDPSITGALSPVIEETVQEFTLLTNQFSAEYGHSAAGQFITTTKSGTNELHGSAWWYSQNRHTNSLDDLNRSVTPRGEDAPRYDWNRFGAQAGGPIIKDKWFYHGAVEYQNNTLGGSPTGVINVPTSSGLSMLQSLASDPTTGISPIAVGIVRDHVPPASAETTRVNVMNEATGQNVEIPFGTFSATTPNFSRTHLFSVGTDFLTARHRFSGRYSYSRLRNPQAGDLPVPQFNSSVAFDTWRAVFSDVFTISPSVVNEFRVGWNRDISDFPLDLPPPPGATDVFANYQISALNLFIGPNSNLPQSGGDNIYNFVNNISWIKGAHTIKFGGEFRNILSKSDFLPRSRGEFDYSSFDRFARDTFPDGVAIRGVGTGFFAANRWAAYGFIQDAWKVSPNVTLELGLRYEFTSTARDSDFQDLNAIASIVNLQGEAWTPELLAFNGFPADDPRLGTNIFSSLPRRHQDALAGWLGNELIFRRPSADNNNFMPRVGLAWDMFGNGKTSLRMGFGISNDVIYGNLPLLQLPPQAQAENRETNACILNPRPAWCAQVAAGQSPLDADIRASTIGFLAGGGLESALPPDAAIDKYVARALTGGYVVDDTSPDVYNWSLSLQHEMFRDFLVELRYVGNHAIHLPVQNWENAGIPNPYRLPTFFTEGEALGRSYAGANTLADFVGARDLILSPYGFGGVITSFRPDGHSWYHGASISVTKRMSRGLAFNANYTWSKTMDFIENDLFTSFLNPRRPFDKLNPASGKALSGLHRTHKFAISWLYDFPRYSGNAFAEKVLNGWQLNGAYLAESGQFVTVISRRDLDGDFDSAGDTAILNPNGRKETGTDSNFVCWDGTAASIATSAAGCGGNANVVGYVARDPNAQYIRGQTGALASAGRNTLEAAGINYWNLGLFKKTSFWGENRYIQFRVEFWNAFNHPNNTIGGGAGIFALTANATGFPGFGTPGTADFARDKTFSGGGGSSPFQRIIQFGLKVVF